MPIGCKVTLRGARMYAFLEKLIHVALPRIRDFRGVPVRGFDGRGNFTLGLKEQTIFPEIAPDQIKKTQGMDVTMVTSATNNEDAKELLLLIGMPFAKRN
jgi:large subunit ribosomal protein L5